MSLIVSLITFIVVAYIVMCLVLWTLMLIGGFFGMLLNDDDSAHGWGFDTVLFEFNWKGIKKNIKEEYQKMTIPKLMRKLF